MAEIPTWIGVVAVALCDESGRLLLQKRPEGRHHAGLWEFPGGKVESRENPREALVREIAEELGIGISSVDLVPALFSDERSDPAIVLFLYTCRCWSGEVEARDGQEWGWFTRAEAAQLPMPPMDADLLGRLVD